MTSTKREGNKLTIEMDLPSTKGDYAPLPVTALTPADLNSNGTSLGAEGVLEFSTSGLGIYCAYASLLTYLTLQEAVACGAMTEAQRWGQVGQTAWATAKDSAVKVVALSTVLACVPALLPVASIAGVVGLGFMGVRLTKAFYSALTVEQRANLRNAANEAGVKLKGLTDQRPDAYGSWDEPMPQGI